MSEQKNDTKKDNKYGDYVMKLPESEKKEEKTLPPNSKPHWMLRLAGAFIDFSLVFLASFGLYQLCLNTPISKGLFFYRTEMINIQDEYKLMTLVSGSDETYGHKVHEDDEDYQKYTTYVVHQEEDGNKYVVVNNETISNEVKKAYNQAISTDETFKNLSFDYKLVDYGLTMLSAGSASLLFLLIIPLINKRRATIGMFFSGGQLIDSKYETRAKWYQVVWRYIFDLIVFIAVPMLFSIYVSVGIGIVLLIPTFMKNGRTLHDVVSRTKMIDKRTFLPIDEQ